MESRVRRVVLVRGRVQGVGFRPMVHRLAVAHGLAGRAWNGPEGLHVELEGSPDAAGAVIAALSDHPPPLARVTAVEVREERPAGAAGFAIVESAPGGFHATLPAPDAGPCAACLAELGDARDRRAGHAFITCTDCGPRFTLARSLPYARAWTTMAAMPLCAACAQEFDDPEARRFHAETLACRECGPRLSFEPWDGGSHVAGDDAALDAAVAALSRGRIVAIKGVGGWHLACDARDEAAVLRLRARKQREARPLAVLVADLAAARAVAQVSGASAAALSGSDRPIVLVPFAGGLAPAVSPGLARVGLMLPPSPLHALVVARFGGPLVLTSGNRSEEPLVRDDAEARARLGGVADAALAHDRAIAHRADDTLVQEAAGTVVMLRRARGWVPDPVALDVPRPLLACGADLKNTVCVAAGGHAFVSQHLGNLHGPEARAVWRDEVQRFTELLAVRPQLAACDLHPDYASRRLAEELGLPLIPVQHHHAHVAACLVEHGLEGPVAALAFDGAGFGPDGTIWGGEVLIASRRTFTRVARLAPVPMPGGDVAAREPWRMALAWLDRAGADVALCGAPDRFSAQLGVLAAAARKGVGAPLTSSAGRLFDAVAAVLGVRAVASYEGQAAMELEALASTATPGEPLPVLTRGEALAELDFGPALVALAARRAAGEPAGALARAFHEALADAACAALLAAAARDGLTTAVLTGGCFQNRLLLEACVERLRAGGLSVLFPVRYPANDGGISLGQAAVAAAKLGGS